MNYKIIKSITPFALLFVLNLFTSCVTHLYSISKSASISKINKNNAELNKINIGESKEQAMSKLKFRIVFVQERDFSNKIFQSPVATDVSFSDNKKIETIYFYTSYKKNDNKATKNEIFYGKKNYDS